MSSPASSLLRRFFFAGLLLVASSFATADLVHNHAVQFARPEVAIEFDIDPKQAVITRKRIFFQAAKEKLMVAGMHLPFPGIGRVRKESAVGYAWVPAEFVPLPK